MNGSYVLHSMRLSLRGCPIRILREDEKEVEEEENSDSDFSVSSDLGPILNVIL